MSIRNIHILAIFTSFIVIPHNFHCQAKDSLAVSLSSLIKRALESNHNARKSRLDLENSENKINEVRSATMPQISGSAGINYNPLLQKSALPGEFFGRPGTTVLLALGQEWNASAGVSLNQIIFNQSVFTGLKAAATTREFYRINSELTEENVIEQVSTAYYGVLVQRQQLYSLDSTIHNMNQLAHIMESQMQNGLVKKVDVNRVTVSVSNLEARRQQLHNAIVVLENQLKFLAGIPIDAKVRFAELDLRTITAELSDTVVQEFSTRTELRLLSTRERLASLQLKNFRSEYYPSLVFIGNYSYQGLGNEFLFTAPEGKVNWFSVATIGLSLRVPLFNGFATHSRTQQARIEMEKILEDRSMTEQAMRLGYENALTQMRNNLLTLNTQRRNVELAEEVYSSTINNYNNGLATLTDLLSAENGLTDAYTNHLTTLLNYKLSEVQLLKAKGELRKLLN